MAHEERLLGTGELIVFERGTEQYGKRRLDSSIKNRNHPSSGCGELESRRCASLHDLEMHRQMENMN